jgi:hypothetical protein
MELIMPNKKSSHEVLIRKYKPKRVRFLLIGESPPAGGTFFYRGDSNLYNYTLNAFQRAFERTFISSEEFLKFFKDSGFYLEDLCLNPINNLPRRQRIEQRNYCVEGLANRLQGLKPEIVIIVMRGIVDQVEISLAAARIGDVDRRCLPFPSQGHQREYEEELTNILIEINNNYLK